MLSRTLCRILDGFSDTLRDSGRLGASTSMDGLWGHLGPLSFSSLAEAPRASFGARGAECFDVPDLWQWSECLREGA